MYVSRWSLLNRKLGNVRKALAICVQHLSLAKASIFVFICYYKEVSNLSGLQAERCIHQLMWKLHSQTDLFPVCYKGSKFNPHFIETSVHRNLIFVVDWNCFLTLSVGLPCFLNTSELMYMHHHTSLSR